MSNFRIVLVALIALAITSMAAAQIYKCDGPDGLVFSDRKCGINATNVELSESSGLGGVSDEIKVELAKKKADREQARNRNNDGALFDNRNSPSATEPAGRWVRDPRRLKDRDAPPDLKPGKQPTPRTVNRRRN